MLLLDEPTSALDDRSEADVIRFLRESSRELTVVVITHRRAILEACDREVVLDRGRIVADHPVR